jgi:hypothetical protein
MARFQRIPMDRKQLFSIMAGGSDESQPLRMGKVDRKPTAQESFMDFLTSCEQVFHDNSTHNLEAVMMSGVGLAPEGKSGLYDLYWFPKQPMFSYCVNIQDNAFVYRLDIGLGRSECSCCHH